FVPLAALATLAWSLIAPAATPQAGTGATAPRMKTYESRYYIIHTDLDVDAAREAYVRMDAMAEEYHRRTRGFGGTVRRKLPFYLFRTREDYYKAGGTVGSAGVFMLRHRGSRLMAFAGKKPSRRTWHVIQHEGFHQFAHAAIRGRFPAWVNEGLAEYFGEAVFTGDAFVTGIVPPRRLARLKRTINAKKTKPFRKIMSMTYKQWSAKLSMGNYDQAWSMIHFLVHAREGGYAKALSGFISNISRGSSYERAWVRSFGRDIEAFEKKYRQWWLAQPKNPSADTYARAVASTMTSFFARAFSQRQSFKSAEGFFKSARAGELKSHKLDWLPPGLLAENLPKATGLGKWSIETPRRMLPRLVCRLKDGRRLVGTFAVTSGRARRVNVKLLPKEKPKEPRKPSPTTRPGRGAAPGGPRSQPAR
ncbi:MAG: DUF1570 domain-containing protein, partial [Planctomycetota bacterium]